MLKYQYLTKVEINFKEALYLGPGLYNFYLISNYANGMDIGFFVKQKLLYTFLMREGVKNK